MGTSWKQTKKVWTQPGSHQTIIIKNMMPNTKGLQTPSLDALSCQCNYRIFL